MEQRTVPFELIDVDDSVNARQSGEALSDKAIGAFAERIATEGLINPLTVQSSGTGRFDLRAGYRRYKAIEKLGWKDVPCMVYPADCSDDHMAVVHYAENLDRQDLTPYDLGMGARAMKKNRTMQLTDFARRTGTNYKMLMRYLSYAEGLPDPILADWKSGHPWLTLKTLQKLWELPQDEAVATWEKMKQGYSANSPEIPKGDPGKGKPKRPPLKDLARLHTNIEECTLPPEAKKHLLAVILYAQGMGKMPKLPRQLTMDDKKPPAAKKVRRSPRKARTT